MKLSKLMEELEEVRDFSRGEDPEIKFFHFGEGQQLEIHRVIVFLGNGIVHLSSEAPSPEDYQREKSVKDRNVEIEKLLTRKGFRLQAQGPQRNNEGVRIRYGAVIIDFDSKRRSDSLRSQIREVLDESGMHSVKIRTNFV